MFTTIKTMRSVSDKELISGHPFGRLLKRNDFQVAEKRKPSTPASGVKVRAYKLENVYKINNKTPKEFFGLPDSLV